MGGFEASIDGWVTDAASRTSDFGELIRALPGVYPSDTLESLLRLQRTGGLPERVVRRALAGVGIPPACAQAEHSFSDLPLPHPLDYDWRFRVSTQNRLLTDVASRTVPGDTIAFLGTPSLVAAAATCLDDRRIVLLENNRAVLARLERFGVTDFDAMLDPAPDLSAPVVVVDPPWYEEYLRSFMWVAAHICKPNGRIYLSFPATGTRPGISVEFDRLEQWAHKLGLVRDRIEPLVLSYDSPYFERNALSALGISNVPPDWRRADLVVFRSVGGVAVERPRTGRAIEPWDEVCLSSMRVKVRKRACQSFGDPSLKPLVPGDILPSVSRRTPGRARVDVWTTGNRVYRCEAPELLVRIARSLAAGTEPIKMAESCAGRRLTATESNLVCKTMRQLVELANTESREARNLTSGVCIDVSAGTHGADPRSARAKGRLGSVHL